MRHHYRYTYTGPVADLRHRLLMVPPDRHGDQRLLTHEVAVRGAKDHRLAWDGEFPADHGIPGNIESLCFIFSLVIFKRVQFSFNSII